MRHKSRSSKLTVPPREGVGHIERIGRKGGRDMIRAGPAAGGGSGKDPPQGGRTPQGGAYHHLDWLVFVARRRRDATSERAPGGHWHVCRTYVNRCFFRILRAIRVPPITNKISFNGFNDCFFIVSIICIVSLSNHRLHTHEYDRPGRRWKRRRRDRLERHRQEKSRPPSSSKSSAATPFGSGVRCKHLADEANTVLMSRPFEPRGGRCHTRGGRLPAMADWNGSERSLSRVCDAH